MATGYDGAGVPGYPVGRTPWRGAEMVDGPAVDGARAHVPAVPRRDLSQAGQLPDTAPRHLEYRER